MAREPIHPQLPGQPLGFWPSSDYPEDPGPPGNFNPLAKVIHQKRLPYVAIVDDDDGMCLAMMRLLQSAGMQVCVFKSGHEALHAISAFKPDCLVLDINLPDFNSLDLFELIILKHPGVPIIIITAWDDDEQRQQAIARGAAGFFYKPFSGEEFLTSIRDALDGRPDGAGVIKDEAG